jgi:hypothetical protein
MQGKGANDMTASIVEPQLNACWSVSNQSSPKIFFLSNRGFGTTLPAERSALGNLRFPYWSGIRLNRKDQSHFECKSCHTTLNADLNGARNIAIKLSVVGMPTTDGCLSISPMSPDV